MTKKVQQKITRGNENGDRNDYIKKVREHNGWSIQMRMIILVLMTWWIDIVETDLAGLRVQN